MSVSRVLFCALPLAALLSAAPMWAGSIELTNIQLFAVPFGAFNNALAINDNGDIAGTSFLPGPQEGFVIPANGGAPIQIVGPSSQYTSVDGINNQGTLTGYYFGTDNNIYGFTYSGGTFTTVSAGSNGLTFPNGINNQGDVVGAFLSNSGGYAGFLDKNGVLTTIVVPGHSQDTYATSVNDSDQVAGYYNAATLGFVRNPNGSFITFGFPASGINNAGIVVGSGAGPGDNPIGDVYDDGGTYSYAYPGAVDTYLYGINNSNLVVGSITTADNTEEIFTGTLVLVGIPEPSSISLCALALLGVFAIAVRRRFRFAR